MVSIDAPIHPSGVSGRPVWSQWTYWLSCSATHQCVVAMQVINNKSAGSKSSTTTTKKGIVVPEPSFNVPLGLLSIAGFSAYEGIGPLAWIAGVLGVFLTVQATRVK